MRRLLLSLSAMIAAVVLAGCSSSGKAAQQPSELNDGAGGGTYHGIGLDPAQPRPSFTLTDTSGQKFAFGQRTAGHPTFLFFGYTNCPDVCPTTMVDIRDAIATQPKALQAKTYVVFVTTDVKHDTAAVMQKWLANFSHGISAHIVGLRGTQDEIDAAQAASHIQLAEDGGQTHSALALLFGSDDYARVEYTQSNNESKSMAHDLPLVA